MADRETLLLIDTYSLIYQVYHAIRQPMTGRSGQPTNAVFGFTRDLRNLLTRQKPSHFICAIDSPSADRESARHEVYADYKANRDPMPENLVPQIPLVMDIIEAHNIPLLSHPNWEADDIIATLTVRAVENGMDVIIVSSDKDLRQLLGPHVRLYNLRKGSFIDVEYLREDWGIAPEQVIDFQSLVGDSVDNIPGVPLVGPKKASALLEQFGTLEEVLANADQAPGKKLKENLVTFAEQARMSRILVTLKTDLDLALEWDDAKVSEPDHDRLMGLYQELNFRSLAKELASEGKGLGGQESDRVWTVIDTDEKFQKFLADLQDQKTFCVDLETSALDPNRAEIVGWAFCWEEKNSYYLPVMGPETDSALEGQTVLDGVGPILADESVTVVNQNIKYDLIVLRRHGLSIANIGMDPMVGHYLLDAGARQHSLEALAERYLQHHVIPITSLIGKGKTQKKMFEVDVPKVAEYASEDADITWRLATIIENELKEQDLYALYWNLERPLIPVLASMEQRGIRIDVAELERQSNAIGSELESTIEEIHKLAEEEFNIDSPKQLRVILFEKLELPVIKRTKTGPSTDQEVLEQLAAKHPLPEKIIQHRQLSKLKSTYLDALPRMVNPETGRVHCSFNQVVTATGRLSSSDPNLQNIPVRTEQGRQVRKAFLPGHEGWRLVCADYSQIELRMLAHYSGDAALLEAFQAGRDIHTSVAAEIFGVDLDHVDSEMRAVAKGVNFGVIYGQSPFGLAGVLGIEQETAATFIKEYFAKYPGVQEFMSETLQQCRRNGYAETILGRRRAISGIRSRPTGQQTTAERTAINTVIQGSAADLIKQAMLSVDELLTREEPDSHLLLQIHDELVLETTEANALPLAKKVQQAMEAAMPLEVPLVVDVSIGENWLEKKTVVDG